jgi:DNA-binding beta-propeller fold protein YncE
MTSRREFLTLVGAGVAATMVGCDAGPARPAADPSIRDVLLVDTTNGLAVLRGGVVQPLGSAVVTPDGQTIYATRAIGSDTELRTLSSRTGVVSRSVQLPGHWTPSVAGAPNDVVALVADAAAVSPDLYAPSGRTSTSVLIVDGATTHRFDLAGNYVPDAFTRDSLELFVLDWVPSTAPEHYRVRGVDLASGEVSVLWGRDKQPIPPEAEEQMRGVRRNAVYAISGDILYTLYTHQPAPGSATAGWSGSDNAFIHTLHLDQRWAYCVDLPAPFGLDPNTSHAIAIDSNGSSLYVVDAAAGKVAVVDTESLEVQRVGDIPPMTGPAYATFAAGALHIAVGARMVPVRRDLTLGTAWSLPEPTLGLLSSVDGTRVYVGSSGAIDWYDVTNRQRLGGSAVDGLVGLRRAV